MKAISSRRPASGLIAELWLAAAPAISGFFITVAAIAAAFTILGAGTENDRLHPIHRPDSQRLINGRALGQ